MKITTDKIKLVIEVPESYYRWIKSHVLTANDQIIARGKLLGEILDDIKAEINERICEDDAERVFEIIDKHMGKERIND